jgi:nucleotide-binding universal stress UspA family protein
MQTSWEGIRTVLESEGEAALDRVEELADGTNVLVEGTIVDGSPAPRIVEHAEQIDCDLVVMGSLGRSGVDRLLLGSVAERVVRSAPVPVLTVRLDGDEPPRSTGSIGSTDAGEPETTDRRTNADSG